VVLGFESAGLKFKMFSFDKKNGTELNGFET
jgi:hypothetical protein